jgi:Calcineurin-like phosphoesterase
MSRAEVSRPRPAAGPAGPVPAPDDCPARPRSERELGFVRRPMVRWFDPGQLAGTAFKMAVSALFGAYADKREIQAALTEPVVHDYAGRRELWLDYVADTGDGFEPTYSVARLVAADHLDLDAAAGPLHLPRADLLVFGGDQVYPTAKKTTYDDRFTGPFKAAFPCTAPEGHPHLYAIPGNHDWYDGLANFLRLFCQRRWVGGWETRQERSYFALKLPGGWWLWAIDIQFDAYVDEPQLEYFSEVATRLGEGDQIILCSAKPSWLEQATSHGNLEFFERKVIGDRGKVAVNLSGDLHHYCRYQGDGGRQRITAGGGGAYLYPTHLMPERLQVDEAGEQVGYQRTATFPSIARSKRLRWGALLLPFRNRGFAVLMGCVYLVLGLLLANGVSGRAGGLLEAIDHAGFYGLLRGGASTLLVGGVLALAMVGYASLHGPGKLVLGALHGLAHLLLLAALVYLAASVWALAPSGVVWTALAFVSVGVAGGIAGGSLVGLYLLLAHIFIGRTAERHTNEAFSCQHLMDDKSFLRLHIGPGGTLTIYPVGIGRVPRRWRLVPDGDRGAPWFEPVADRLAGHLVEPPIVVAASPGAVGGAAADGWAGDGEAPG